MIKYFLSSLAKLFAFLFKGNKLFIKIIKDFEKKLPPTTKKALKSDDHKLGVTHFNLNHQKSAITIKELDELLRTLEVFDYDSIYFNKKNILDYSNNLQRIIKTSEYPFVITFLQEIIDNPIFSRKIYLKNGKLKKYINC